MQLGYRGSVNSWECDENDHLNVRFYVEKHWQTLCGALPAFGVREPVKQLSLRCQHLRFLQESRLAAPLSGYAGVLASAGNARLLTELRHSFTDEVLSTCIHELTLEIVAPEFAALPDHAAPRGVADADLEYGKLGLDSLADHGFHVIGRGVVQSLECDAAGGDEGAMAVHNYMGRISDSMPHLWGLLGARGGELDPGEGGAVLEYRLRYHSMLAAGETFELHSGLAAVGPKVQRFAHLMFNASRRELAVSAEAAGVRMDLAARKALTLSDARQAEMRERLLQPV